MRNDTKDSNDVSAESSSPASIRLAISVEGMEGVSPPAACIIRSKALSPVRIVKSLTVSGPPIS